MTTGAESRQKKQYEKPEVIFSEKIEALAIGCALADAAACSDGPILS